MNALRELFRGENNYNFHKLWRYGFVLSGVLLSVTVLSLAVQRLELGIDFKGGTAWEVPTSSLSVGDARDALRPLGLATAKVQTIGNATLRVQGPTGTPEETGKVTDALGAAAQIDPNQIAVTEVGPSWGKEISGKAVRALVAFFVVVTLYISLALRSWRMAVGALVAVVHDVIISAGVYSILRLEVTPATVIAFLTILGFSLYDTVVVFAKLRENSGKFGLASRMTYSDLASLSLNQVLMRSINTSLTALMPVISILVVGAFILGATSLEEFGLALLVGLIAGAYSSIFIATPIVAWLKEREPQNKELRERLTKDPSLGLSGPAVSDAVDAALGEPVAVGAATRVAATNVQARALPPTYSSTHPPRPRKNRRR